jgi:uncharacterized protein (TIGR02996 family)
VTERESFIRCVCENPADDTPRLVFADWLDDHADSSEQGQADRARARFIRHQCAEARHNRDVFYPASQAVAEEWNNGPGKGVAGPVQVNRDTPAGKEYFRTFYQSRLMETQGRLMLERWARVWLQDLVRAILPSGYYLPLQIRSGTGTWKVAGETQPRVIVHRNNAGGFRDWIEFQHPVTLGHSSTGPLFGFRRGFVSKIAYGYFYKPATDERLVEMFRTNPIEQVRSDREPMANLFVGPNDESDHYGWLPDDIFNGNIAATQSLESHLIPRHIFDRLPRHVQFNDGRYPTEQAAKEDFQWAAVALGRELVFLPMLPKPEMPEKKGVPT